MLFDFLFDFGGSALVTSFDQVFAPFFDFVCTGAEQFGGVWNIIATIFEILFS